MIFEIFSREIKRIHMNSCFFYGTSVYGVNCENDREKTFKVELISIKKEIKSFIFFWQTHSINSRKFMP